MKILFTLILSALFFVSFSQDDFMDEITKNVCSCIESKVSEEVNYESLEMDLGICLIEASLPYEKEIKKEYGIDIFEMNESSGEELGRVIGIKMVIICPETALKLFGDIRESGKYNQYETKEYLGIITEINKGTFIEFTIKDEKGKKMKFIWLEYFETDFNIEENYELMIDKLVEITYDEREFFDHRINEYKTFNIITSLTKE